MSCVCHRGMPGHSSSLTQEAGATLHVICSRPLAVCLQAAAIPQKHAAQGDFVFSAVLGKCAVTQVVVPLQIEMSYLQIAPLLLP